MRANCCCLSLTAPRSDVTTLVRGAITEADLSCLLEVKVGYAVMVDICFSCDVGPCSDDRMVGVIADKRGE